MPREDFVEIFTVTDPKSQLVAVVTRRKNSNYPRLSCAIQREFEGSGGEMQQSFWLLKRHLQALIKFVPTVIARIEEEEQKLLEVAAGSP